MPAACRADTIHLKSGETIEGTIVTETDWMVVVESGEESLLYTLDEIARIEVPEPPPEAPASPTPLTARSIRRWIAAYRDAARGAGRAGKEAAVAQLRGADA